MPITPDPGWQTEDGCDCRFCIAARRDEAEAEAAGCDCGDCEYCGYVYDRDPESHASGETETWLSRDQRLTITTPLHRMLRRGGRYFSAEVELNELDADASARVLGCEVDGYGARSNRTGTIMATDDCTVDAEIKLGRFRDGAVINQTARAAYDTLRDAGATCAENCGHHVHVDATRLVDEGLDAITAVLRYSLTLAHACEPALLALASSGYTRHRDTNGDGYGGNLKTHIDNALTGRSAWHASNAAGMIHYSNGIPTFEYRLPNGTLEPIRAHAHIATALGLLDFGERCHDGDSDARDYYRQANDRITHAQTWSQADAAAILTRAIHYHPDALHALALTSATSPASAQTTSTFNIAAAA